MKFFGQHVPPMERAGRAAAADRERRAYGDLGYDEDEEPSFRRKDKAPRTKKAEEPPRVEGQADYDAAVAWFQQGNKVTVSDEQSFADYFAELNRVPKLAETTRAYLRPETEGELAFGMELVLEALHQSLRLTREDLDSTITFSELMKFNVLRTVK